MGIIDTAAFLIDETEGRFCYLQVREKWRLEVNLHPILEHITTKHSNGNRDFRDLGSLFQGVMLSRLKLESINLEGANFSESELKIASLRNMKFAGSSFRNARLSVISFLGSNFENTDFRNAFFSKCDLRFCVFNGANLSGATFQNCLLKHSKFINAEYDRYTVFPKNFFPEKRKMKFVNHSEINDFTGNQSKKEIGHDEVGNIDESELSRNLNISLEPNVLFSDNF